MRIGLVDVDGHNYVNFALMRISAFHKNRGDEVAWVRIRKLTPREVFRLMDVDEHYIDKILSAGISDSQLYKMGGNSICVGVMEKGIFYNLFSEEEVYTGTLF